MINAHEDEYQHDPFDNEPFEDDGSIYIDFGEEYAKNKI